jgi:hypothetical protein
MYANRLGHVLSHHLVNRYRSLLCIEVEWHANASADDPLSGIAIETHRSPKEAVRIDQT